MSDNKRLMWFKGDIIPISDAKINVLSPTSQFGANVFEGLRAYWNAFEEQLYIFKLSEHTDRLQNSMKMLEFEVEFSSQFLRQSVIDIIQANKFQEDLVCRQTIFLDGFGSWSTTSPVEMFIAPMAKGRYYDKGEGLDVCISSWERINEKSLSPKIKMGANYMNSRMGQLEARRNGYDSAIFLNSQGTVSEGPGSCVFIVKDGVLITPPLTASILDSITRSTVIDIARNDLGLSVIERDIKPSELHKANEVFMCGTAVEIIPVFSVDRAKIGIGVKGKVTLEVENLYFKIVRGEVERYKKWLTPVYKG
ncbi:Branched-chain amino acid aminotransferase (EC 2.6.1.42) [uncultured Gammaproteobacteria bacterium]|nr:Branched-chain amino acid aminotransferase (EC 2.6.1.42) [uncultured Gammaproteobacteria bacterium]CAC9608148.1 Branched-chain amino acid aminotransferase (EC 2.6.1.42) [uncultured Gammaproteobacteria bacterium]CAC9968695.1 Branched-chain amino acid aminotransferase (EC 2.6.1.42) [uncultured Gammaproteobacteria bacterium]